MTDRQNGSSSTGGILLALLLAAFAPAGARAQSAMPDDHRAVAVPGPALPSVRALIDTSDFVRSLHARPDADSGMKRFVGMVIEESYVREIYPLLPMVFFEEGSAEMPDRYRRFADAEEVAGFDQNSVAGGTLEKYRHLLDIVGFRLRRFPDKKITLRGHDTRQPAIGETASLSKRRAEAVARYLIEIWGVSPERIGIDSTGGYPRNRSNPLDSVANSENRRVEIVSDDWEIVGPLEQIDNRRYPDPEQMQFATTSVYPAALVSHRQIEIVRRGRPWHTITIAGADDSKPVEWNWGRNGDVSDIPLDEAPFTATLVVHLKDGRQTRSLPVEIPVRIVAGESTRTYCFGEKRSIYSLHLFDVGKSAVGPVGRRIVRDLIAGEIGPRSRVVITGYACHEPDPLRASRDRSVAVAAELKNLVAPTAYNAYTKNHVGDDAPLYNETLPEGRFYNRTVQLRITVPVDYWGRPEKQSGDR